MADDRLVLDAVDVVVEVPKGSRNKYEYDRASGRLRLTGRLQTPAGYPAEYGFIPMTLSADGEPLDAIVLLEEPTFPGCLIETRPVGLLPTLDDSGYEPKVICVPLDEPSWDGVFDIAQVPDSWLSVVRAFFETYKDDTPDRWSAAGSFGDAAEAHRLIAGCRERCVSAT